MVISATTSTVVSTTATSSRPIDLPTSSNVVVSAFSLVIFVIIGFHLRGRSSSIFVGSFCLTIVFLLRRLLIPCICIMPLALALARSLLSVVTFHFAFSNVIFLKLNVKYAVSS
jgi:hypothetical protein